MASPTTSLQRTYRYLRLAIVGLVVVIFVSVALAAAQVGVLPSLSHYYYSPARTMFVGALIAASVCLLVLSGRGAQRALLDAAALLLPLVAIVPAMIEPGSVPGVEVPCSGPCVSSAVVADIDNGVATYLIVGGAALVVSAVLIATGQTDREGGMLSLAVAAIVLGAVWAGWALWHESFVQWGHVIAAGGFFAVIAVVSLVAAFVPDAAVVSDRDARALPTWLRVSYIAIAVALLTDLLVLAVFAFDETAYGVLIGEVIALTLFLAFWVLQSVQNWNDRDPATIR